MGKGVSVAFVVMVTAVLAQVTSMILNKEAMSSGLSECTLVVYSNALSTLILTPSSFIFHRASSTQLLHRLQLLLTWIYWVCKKDLAGLNYASATLNTAILNLIPAFTFILALLFSAVAWCLLRTGPVYVFLFKLLAVVVAYVIDVIFLGQALHLRSLVGAAVIITGFDAVKWGRAREEKLHEDSGEGPWSESSSESTP
ncbi:WAT1-related protein [Prunus yedoensis var. nudiflora]|uniref:WAT1-related protein n=1 Tax=Prunus yedoensis var. nudiflora TaxID=2094558 RepID=A0A314XQ70_PRUYE|nr:WAT1-related protein [Prunus yedoensis var. nudiflora]